MAFGYGQTQLLTSLVAQDAALKEKHYFVHHYYMYHSSSSRYFLISEPTTKMNFKGKHNVFTLCLFASFICMIVAPAIPDVTNKVGYEYYKLMIEFTVNVTG